MMVYAIASHKIIISIKADKGFLNPKNKTDHKRFRNNCTPKTMNAVLFFFLLIHTRYKAIPIMIYNTVQTGPNNHEGGLNEGFDRAIYHVETEDDVNMLPKKPVIKGMIMDIASLIHFFIIIA